MKILIVSNLYPPNVVGGYEVLCAEVTEGLAQRGHEMTVLTSCYGGKLSQAQDVTVHQALRLAVGNTIYDGFDGTDEQRRILDRDNANAFRRALQYAQPDVIYCWNLYGLGHSFIDVVTHANVPVVVMLTDNWLAAMVNPTFIGEYFNKNVYSPSGNDVPLRDLPKVSATFVTATAIFGSSYMKELYQAAGLTFDRETIIHNGIIPSANPCGSPADRIHLRSAGEVRLLFAGRVVEIKGAHTAVEALAILHSSAPPGRTYRLTVLGDARDTGYLDRLKKLASKQGCLDKIEFAEPVGLDKLYSLFQSHDIYLFPSLYEPFSLTLIHALRAGVPTVASSVGGNVEIVKDFETGLLFNRNDAASMADAIERLCDDPELRLRISAEGRVAAASFSFERMLNRMQEHLEAATAQISD